MRGVGEIRLELDRAGRLQDLVVDEAERALIQLDRIVLAVGENRKQPLALLLLLLLNERQIGFREREYQRNRLELPDEHDAVRICRADGGTDVTPTNSVHHARLRTRPGVAQLYAS